MGPASKAKAHSVMSIAFPKLAVETNKLKHVFRALPATRCFKVFPDVFPPCHSHNSPLRKGISSHLCF